MAKTLNFKKAPVRISKEKPARKSRKKADTVLVVGTAVQEVSHDICPCPTWTICFVFIAALLGIAYYGNSLAQQEFRRGVGHGACSWELQKDLYPDHHRYGCKITTNHDFDVEDVDAWQVD